MLKLVPFNNAWIDHTKLDLKAIYRRPRWTKDEFDQDVQELGPDGQPLWDLTGPLPVRQHNKWMAKGFQYVTLADRDSLLAAAQQQTLLHGSYREFDQHQTGGPWNAKMYMAGQQTVDTEAVRQLRESVQRFGSEAYEVIRREVDPKFRLPAQLRGIEPGGELPPLKASTVSQSATAGSGATYEITAQPTKESAPKAPRKRRNVSAAGKKKEPVQA